jgi:hypothetical protein
MGFKTYQSHPRFNRDTFYALPSIHECRDNLTKSQSPKEFEGPSIEEDDTIGEAVCLDSEKIDVYMGEKKTDGTY